MRTSQDVPHANWLLSVGDGSANDSPKTFNITMPTILLKTNLNELFGFCFGENFDKADKTEAAILCPTNEVVNSVNDLIIDSILKDNIQKRSYFPSNNLLKVRDRADADDQFRVNITEEYLNSLQSAGLPPHHLKLALGVLVILIRNLRLAGGLCNGTRLKILELYDNTLLYEVMWRPCLRGTR